jgi:hypothetical protein
MIKNIKEKLIGSTGSVSGFASILGSWQICHNVCLGLIALLAVLGITVVGMPLAFLTTVAIPLWILAFALLLVTIAVYYKKKCISKNLIILNSGFIVAGVPFAPVQSFISFFYTIGGILVTISITLFIKDKINKRKVKK